MAPDASQGDDYLHKEGVGNFRTLRLLGDGDGDDSSSSSDDDDNVTSLHIPQDLILKVSQALSSCSLNTFPLFQVFKACREVMQSSP